MVETRSQRQALPPRPPYPQITTQSASSSTFQSSSSLASLSSVGSPARLTPGSSASMLPQHGSYSASAPLPSPSTGQPMNYFGGVAQSQVQSQQASYAAQQRLQPQAASVNPYLGQRGDGRGMPETAPYLQDYNLVAEAAKRAQMACLARDLGEVGL